MQLTVCRYDRLGPGGMASALEVYPRHAAYVAEFVGSGEILLIGTFADPATDGSMGVFRSREGAERFVAGDPFVTEGVIAEWRLLDWNADVYGAIGPDDQ
jgi:uncharacterized protein